MFRKLLFLLPWIVLLGGCGQVITKPTPTPFSPAPSPLILSPTPTPTPTATPTPIPATPLPTPTPTPEPTPILHTLQPGDTLIGLARQYGVTVQAIQEANGITDPRGLLAGQQIIIPTDPEARLGAGEQSTPPPTPPPIHISPLTFSQGADGLWALGQAALETAPPLENVLIQVDLLDEQGEIIASAQSPLLQDMLAPGETAGFALRFSPQPPAFDRYQSHIISAQPAHAPFYHRDLLVQNVLIQTAGESVVTFSGQVKNTGNDTAYQVAVIITLLDASGQATGLRRVTTSPPDIPPGETAFFAAQLIPIRLPFADYRLLAEGRHQLTPDE